MIEWKNNHNKKVLLVEGARQIGKTYLVKKFAQENYKYVIYINLLEEAGEDLLTIYDQIKEERLSGKLDRENTNSLKEMFKRFSEKFKDNEECIIIIDEIQESYKIYNMIRQFARQFETHFIMTGSYLGRVVMQKEFWSRNITKENCNRALQWFYTSKFVKDCDKLVDFDFTNIKKRQRYFLSDIGMAKV